MDVTYWQSLLDAIYRGQRLIITSTALAPAHQTAMRLEEFGATTLCVVASRGTHAPDDEACSHPPIVVDELVDRPAPPAHDTMDSVRHVLAMLADLPDEAIARINAFDPERKARCIGPIFDDGAPFCERPKFGARPATWQALEDKTIIDALWQKVGIPHASYRIVAFDADALTTAHRELGSENQGSVFAVDNGNGFHGGASGTQWIQEPSHIDEFMEHFAHDGIKQVRVMPFLEGIPCSIHGIVFPDEIITLRPCEMIIFRAPGTRRFYYAGSATYWEPDVSVRDAMRQYAKQAGEHLRVHHDYRGAFTIDGVLTATHGFLPTELNPRFGAALGYIGAGVPDLSLLLLNLAVVEGARVDWRATHLERTLRDAADTTPRGSLGINVPQRPSHMWSMMLHRDPEHGLRIAGHDQEEHAKLGFGPVGAGGYLRISPTHEHLPGNGSFAPMALEMLRFARQMFGLGLAVESLECAREM